MSYGLVSCSINVKSYISFMVLAFSAKWWYIRYTYIHMGRCTRALVDSTLQCETKLNYLELKILYLFEKKCTHIKSGHNERKGNVTLI
jgi:hypothetical protein